MIHTDQECKNYEIQFMEAELKRNNAFTLLDNPQMDPEQIERLKQVYVEAVDAVNTYGDLLQECLDQGYKPSFPFGVSSEK